MKASISLQGHSFTKALKYPPASGLRIVGLNNAVWSNVAFGGVIALY